MNHDHIRKALTEWDPARRESPDEKMLAETRRAILQKHEARSPVFSRTAAAYALGALVVATSLVGVLVINRPSGLQSPAAGPTQTPAQETLQLHYDTPGGTRIVWTIDPNFSL